MEKPRFSAAGPAVVRTPAFSTSVLHDIYAAPDVDRALQARLENDAALLATIELATPSLGDAIRNALAGDARPERRVLTSALAYVIRSTTRCTPLAACAAVSLVELSGDDDTSLRCAAQLNRRSRPDAGWLYGIAHDYENRVAELLDLRVRPSGAAYSMHGRLAVADVARTAPSMFGNTAIPSAIPTTLNATPAVAAVIDAARGGASIRDVAAVVSAAVERSSDEVVPLIARLVELGILITDLRVPLTGNPAEALARALRTCDPATAARLDAFRASLADFDAAAVEDAPRVYASALRSVEDLHAAEHYVQIDAQRDVTGTIGRDVTEAASRVLDELAQIAPRRRRNRNVARAFAARYNAGREVPLLELLDPSEGLKFEESLDSPPAPDDRRRDEILLSYVAESLARRETSVELDELRLAPLRQPPSDDVTWAVGYEILAPIVKDAGGRVVPLLTSGAMEGMYRSTARFDDIIGAALHEPQPTGDEEIAAELVVLPHRRRLANVATHAGRLQYEVVCGVNAGVPAENALTMDDLVVGVRDERVYVRSRRLGKILRVEQNHVLNPRAASRIASFFAAIGSSDVPAISFSWGSLAARLPFRPRASIAGVVVSLASWSVPRGLVLDFAGSAAREWRALWRVPRYVYLTFTDNRLLIDLDSTLGLAQLKRAAGKLGDDELAVMDEAYPFFGDEAVFDRDGRGYFAEVALSFRADVPQRARKAASAPAVASAAKHVALRPPGSDWVYAKFYVSQDYTDYFLERTLAPLFASLRPVADNEFFIRYNDPDHHIRFRVQSADAQRLLLLVAEHSRRWVESGIITRVAFDTYDREVERYGGEDCIELAESCFTLDSAAVLERLPELRAATDRTQWLLDDLAAFVAAFHPSLADAHAWLRRVTAKRGKADKESWERIRACRTTFAARAEQPLAVPAHALYARLSAGARDDVLRAVVHMHCNRVGMSPAEEDTFLGLVTAAYDGLVAAERGTRTGAPAS